MGHKNYALFLYEFLKCLSDTKNTMGEICISDDWVDT